MINRRIIRQEVDDYTKVMGAYDREAVAFNDQVAAAKAGSPYLVPYNNGYGISEGAAEGGLKLRQDGNNAVMASFVPSLAAANPGISGQFLRNQDGTATELTRTQVSTDGETGQPVYNLGYGNRYSFLSATPVLPDTKPPSLTVQQTEQLNNPTATYPEALRAEASRLNTNAGFKPMGDSSKGILQRIMEGTA